MATATKTRTALDNELREKQVTDLIALLTEKGEDVLRVGGNVIAYPTLDSAGNESWVEITVKLPKGERLGAGEGFAGYDGYEQAKFYANEQQTKADETERKRLLALAKESAKKKGKTPTATAEQVVEPTTEPSEEGEE